MKKVGRATRPLRYDLNHIPYYDTVEVTKRFKGLDLVDRMSEEIWTEVHNTVQEVVTKTIPKKKKCNKEKWLSEEALQIAEERREAKSKGEKERYTLLNAEFQRIAREARRPSSMNNAMKQRKSKRGKMKDLFKKIGCIKETFQAKMSQ